ncbi:universal stress protein [Nocardia mexicana]|uniref:Nucleotide-binding universal stress UspA family protein n=1 Tax=Nocardia mexicana TaxID=279262 RepID=A0A370HAH9_9NOCA|nr:universal stress protein [Nocardia mexicana]RDI53946.1 nucleotide-binding universal stress UspA family protein [Nocardia mexicana]
MDRHNDRPIVVGVDDSPSAIPAARWAADLAAREQVSLLLVSTIPAPDYPVAAGGRAERDLLRTFSSVARRRAERVADIVQRDQPSLPIRQLPRVGDPVRELVATSADARMVVVAGPDTRRLPTLLTGSIAERVAEKSHCPVAVWHGRLDDPLSDRRPVLVDLGASAGTGPIGNAFELAELLDVDVIAMRSATPPRRESARLSPQQRNAVRTEQLVAGWQRQYPNVRVTNVIEPDTSARTRAARAGNAQMVVSGDRGGNRLSGMLSRSVSQNLMYRAPCPMIVCDSHELIQPPSVRRVGESARDSGRSAKRARRTDAELTTTGPIG